jgi:hypothetical protein
MHESLKGKGWGDACDFGMDVSRSSKHTTHYDYTDTTATTRLLKPFVDYVN